MEDLKQELQNELAILKKELAICEKEIAKRNDKQKDYILEKAEILSDIEAITEEISMLESEVPDADEPATEE
jgi:sugar-specific transcriptional regulator TrmB